MSELIDVNISKKKLAMLVKGGYFIKNENGTYTTTDKFAEYLKNFTENNCA
jgi:predicted transcriptional regulator